MTKMATDCEKCGYSLSGLPSQGPRCPECGAIASMQPTPVPWQALLSIALIGGAAGMALSVAVGVNTLVPQWYAMLVIEPIAYYSLLALSTSLITALISARRSLFTPSRRSRKRLTLVLWGAVVYFVAVFIALLCVGLL